MRGVLRYCTFLAVASLLMLATACVSLPTGGDDSRFGGDQRLYLYDSLVFEIAPMGESVPDPHALRYFIDRLHGNAICRRDKVTIFIAPPEKLVPPWQMTMHTVVWFDKTHRQLKDLDPTDRDGYVFVSYIEGPIWENGVPKAIGGVHYAHDAFAVVGPDLRQGSVLLHEMGHVIGLVSDDKADSDHPLHCRNRNCVMYYSAWSGYTDFDKDCKRRIQRLIRVARAPKREVKRR